jgi:hypothetical protein
LDAATEEIKTNSLFGCRVSLSRASELLSLFHRVSGLLPCVSTAEQRRDIIVSLIFEVSRRTGA